MRKTPSRGARESGNDSPRLPRLRRRAMSLPRMSLVCLSLSCSSSEFEDEELITGSSAAMKSDSGENDDNGNPTVYIDSVDVKLAKSMMPTPPPTTSMYETVTGVSQFIDLTLPYRQPHAGQEVLLTSVEWDRNAWRKVKVHWTGRMKIEETVGLVGITLRYNVGYRHRMQGTRRTVSNQIQHGLSVQVSQRNCDDPIEKVIKIEDGVFKGEIVCHTEKGRDSGDKILGYCAQLQSLEKNPPPRPAP